MQIGAVVAEEPAGRLSEWLSRVLPPMNQGSLPSVIAASPVNVQPAVSFSTPALAIGVYRPRSPKGVNDCDSMPVGVQFAGFAGPLWACAGAASSAAAPRVAPSVRAIVFKIGISGVTSVSDELRSGSG